MFTGIIETTGTLARRDGAGDDQTLTITSEHFDFSRVRPGDSIAVNGVCLTATRLEAQGFSADVSAETLRRTTLGGLAPGAAVNLEGALTLATPLGGHLVSGHVDGVGTLIGRSSEARSERLEFRVPHDIAHYIATKGSITVDGISLTVNRVEGDVFSVNIIPHTSARTTLAEAKVGQKVNLEVDLIARYVERLLQGKISAQPLSLEALQKAGF